MTPLKRKREEDILSEAGDDASELLSPQGPTVIGPTPQRDGIVLGLFDLLSAETPSKKRVALVDVEPNVLQTPSRKLQEAASEASLESRARGDRTPLSAGKRFLFNQFVTPKKQQLDEEGTPTTALRGLATPAFLRRDNSLGVIDEADEATPRPAPWKRRGLGMGRSLSAMIQAMKKGEDDRLDEEADIMRELEMEEEGAPVSRKPRLPEIQVEDSQAMPLGPDRGVESEEDEESGSDSGLGPDGKPRKVWKKKGLKRQTRRVISMFLVFISAARCAFANYFPVRPNFVKPQAPPTLQTQSDDDETEQSMVQGTQVQTNDENEDDDDESDYASDASHSTKKRKALPKKVEEPKKEGIVKTTARKIKATAHANYQRLKIRGKGGNGNGAKGKFGRRR